MNVVPPWLELRMLTEWHRLRRAADSRRPGGPDRDSAAFRSKYATAVRSLLGTYHRLWTARPKMCRKRSACAVSRLRGCCIWRIWKASRRSGFSPVGATAICTGAGCRAGRTGPPYGESGRCGAISGIGWNKVSSLYAAVCAAPTRNLRQGPERLLRAPTAPVRQARRIRPPNAFSA